jgi:hypothetical protein
VVKPSTIVCSGQRWTRFGRECRVMAVIEGYVVFRFKRAMPGICHWRDFEREYRPCEESKERK